MATDGSFFPALRRTGRRLAGGGAAAGLPGSAVEAGLLRAHQLENILGCGGGLFTGVASSIPSGGSQCCQGRRSSAGYHRDRWQKDFHYRPPRYGQHNAKPCQRMCCAGGGKEGSVWTVAVGNTAYCRFKKSAGGPAFAAAGKIKPFLSAALSERRHRRRTAAECAERRYLGKR